MKKQTKNTTIPSVTVTEMNNLGYGVCRIDGMICFIAGGVTGDLLDVKIIKSASSYLVARIERVIEPSRHRAERECRLSTRCGGCSYDGVERLHELEVKRQTVISAFRREGLTVDVADTVSDGRVYGYRNKVAYPVDGGEVGYYGAHTHKIVPCGGRCPLALPAINEASGFIADALAAAPVAGLRHVFIRAGEGTGELIVCFVVRTGAERGLEAIADGLIARFPNIAGVVININPDDTNVILGKEFATLRGRGYIEDELCGLRFRLSPAAFYQVNRPMAEALYRRAAEVSGLTPGQTLLDLFCGTGTVGLSMAASLDGVKLTGVEIVPEAIENARFNAKANGMEDAEFVCADANAFDVGEYDVIVLDPPRKGVAPGLIDRIAASGNRRVVYISCNPVTLARDCKLFAARGYGIGEVAPFDLFPRTGHVETVVLITRS